MQCSFRAQTPPRDMHPQSRLPCFRSGESRQRVASPPKCCSCAAPQNAAPAWASFAHLSWLHVPRDHQHGQLLEVVGCINEKEFLLTRWARRPGSRWGGVMRALGLGGRRRRGHEAHCHMVHRPQAPLRGGRQATGHERGSGARGSSPPPPKGPPNCNPPTASSPWCHSTPVKAKRSQRALGTQGTSQDPPAAERRTCAACVHTLSEPRRSLHARPAPTGAAGPAEPAAEPK